MDNHTRSELEKMLDLLSEEEKKNLLNIFEENPEIIPDFFQNLKEKHLAIQQNKDPLKQAEILKNIDHQFFLKT